MSKDNIKNEFQSFRIGLQEVLCGKLPKTKSTPTKPVMEIDKDNQLWMTHVINKKSKHPSGLKINITIEMGSVVVTLTQNGELIDTAKNKHDINLAITQVKNAFATNNLIKSMNVHKR